MPLHLLERSTSRASLPPNLASGQPHQRGGSFFSNTIRSRVTSM